MFIKLNLALAFEVFLSADIKLRIMGSNNKHPNMIFNICVGSIDAIRPPNMLPTIPNNPSLIPGFKILSITFKCVHAPLVAVGIIMARLVPRDIIMASDGSTPRYSNRKYWNGTIKKSSSNT